MSPTILDFCERLAKGIASQFGNDCEVVVHDLEHLDTSPSTIVAIANGHVTGRDIGDSISPEMAALLQEGADKLGDQFAYLNKTPDNRLIKSTAIFFRDPNGKPIAALSINYDITMLIAVERILTEQAASVYLQDVASFVVLQKNVSGYRFYPLYVMDLASIEKN